MRWLDFALLLLAATCAFLLGVGFYVALRGGDSYWVFMGLVGLVGFWIARELVRFSR